MFLCDVFVKKKKVPPPKLLPRKQPTTRWPKRLRIDGESIFFRKVLTWRWKNSSISCSLSFSAVLSVKQPWKHLGPMTCAGTIWILVIRTVKTVNRQPWRLQTRWILYYSEAYMNCVRGLDIIELLFENWWWRVGNGKCPRRFWTYNKVALFQYRWFPCAFLNWIRMAAIPRPRAPSWELAANMGPTNEKKWKLIFPTHVSDIQSYVCRESISYVVDGSEIPNNHQQHI